MSNPSLLQAIKSVLASLIGVQSEANRRKDFASESPGMYIIAGLIITALIVFILIFVVSIII